MRARVLAGLVAASITAACGAALAGDAPSWGPEPSDRQVIEEGTEHAAQLRRVARLEIAFPAPATGSWPCSGFLVANDLLLTCHHCVGSASTCSRASVTFYGDDGKPTHETRCREVVAHGGVYRDYSLIRLSTSPGSTLGSFRLARERPAQGTPAYLVGYPKTNRLRRTYSECAVQATNREAVDLRHNCQSGPGSSGGPLVDAETEEAIAVHCGSDKRRALGWGVSAELLAPVVRGR